MKIIGREKEIEVLKSSYESDKSDFIAVYGRRRVGKTFLVKELFGDLFTFYATGILNENKDKLAEIAEFLFTKETISGEEFMEILKATPEKRVETILNATNATTARLISDETEVFGGYLNKEII